MPHATHTIFDRPCAKRSSDVAVVFVCGWLVGWLVCRRCYFCGLFVVFVVACCCFYCYFYCFCCCGSLLRLWLLFYGLLLLLLLQFIIAAVFAVFAVFCGLFLLLLWFVVANGAVATVITFEVTAVVAIVVAAVVMLVFRSQRFHKSDLMDSPGRTPLASLPFIEEYPKCRFGRPFFQTGQTPRITGGPKGTTPLLESVGSEFEPRPMHFFH